MTKKSIECADAGDVMVKSGAEILAAPLTDLLRMITKIATAIDLSSLTAVVELPLLHSSVAGVLQKIIILYTEASSGDAGVAITIGKEGSAAYYFTGTTEISKAQWYEKELTLLKTDIGAGNTVTVNVANNKTGTGEIIVIAEYVVNQITS